MQFYILVDIQTEEHTAELFVPELTALVLRLLSESWKRYKPPGIDQIPAEMIQAGGGGVHSEIYKLIKLIWNKEELPYQWKE
jgi:hypothetical protein